MPCLVQEACQRRGCLSTRVHAAIRASGAQQERQGFAASAAKLGSFQLLPGDDQQSDAVAFHWYGPCGMEANDQARIGWDWF